jgi:hypothetical protein
MKLHLIAAVGTLALFTAGCPGETSGDAAADQPKAKGTVERAESDVRKGADEAVEKVESGKAEADVRKGAADAKKKIGIK